MSNVQRLRPLFPQPEELHLTRKSGKPDWFDGREVRVAPAGKDDNGTRTIVLSVAGPAGEFHLPLSAGEAAHLMFEIGHALECAAAKARSH